jgi:hypothetical protein
LVVYSNVRLHTVKALAKAAIFSSAFAFALALALALALVLALAFDLDLDLLPLRQAERRCSSGG